MCNMKDIYLIGSCYFECSAIKIILNKSGYENVYFFKQHMKPKVEDIFIFALSDTPLLGWGRYMVLIKKYKSLFCCKTMVLTPQGVPVHILNDKEIHFTVGDLSVERLISTLKKLVKNKRVSNICKKRKTNNKYWYKPLIRSQRVILKDQVTGTSTNERMLFFGVSSKMVSYRKIAVTRRLGFSSLHLLRVYVAGINSDCLSLIGGEKQKIQKRL